MDLRQLREETRPEHEATEAAMPLMAPGLTLDAYREVLRVLLTMVRSWEEWAAGHAPLDLRPLLAPRRRSHLLQADLHALPEPDAMQRIDAPPSGGAIDWDAVVASGAGPASDPAAPEFTAAFLGVMYVLEGSTLGGRMIARHLEPVFGFKDGRGDAYFRGHGETTGALWRETTAAIAAVPTAHAGVVIGSARRTFEAFRGILMKLEPIVPSEPVPG